MFYPAVGKYPRLSKSVREMFMQWRPGLQSYLGEEGHEVAFRRQTALQIFNRRE